jgi:hypothetical protein
MKRWLAALLLGGLGLGAARAGDVVYYKGPADKDRVKLSGEIQAESAAWVKVKTKAKGTVKQVPAAHILQIDYDVPDVGTSTFRKPFNLEEAALKAAAEYGRLEGVTPKDAKEKKALDFQRAKARKTRDTKLEEALKEYEELERKSASRETARRYLQYKRANLLAVQARFDESKTKEAMAALSKFKDDHPGGWQIVPALLTLGKMQVAAGALDEARKTYEALAEVPDVPRALKQESELLVARLYLRAEKYADAEKKLASVDKAMAKNDPQRAYITALRAESQIGQNNLKQAEALLKEAIRSSSDGRLRGLAHNLLGDYYRRKGQPGEAFWHYLRVDVLYDQDPEEHAKALYYLIGLFDRVKNDSVRSQDCAQRLRDGRFAGTRYQALAGTEKK